MSDSATVVPEIQELGSFILSGKKERKWQWIEHGVLKKGGETFVKVYSSGTNTELLVSITGVRTGGIHTSESKGARGFMSINLTEDQSALIKTKIDKPLQELIFPRKDELLNPRHADRIKNPTDLSIIFNGLVREGGIKDSDTKERWPDQITASIPMMKRNKKGKPPSLDDSLLTVEDLDGNPFPWKDVGNVGNLAEVVLEITKVTFDTKGNISVRGTFRYIAVDAKAIPKITTKRKLGQLNNNNNAGREYAPTNVDIVNSEPAVKKVRPLPTQIDL
jgi:hypothetical protein